MTFNPGNYLRGLGWGGEGVSLQPHNPTARAKPITVAQKKTLSGIGKDRDVAYPWWEMVFSNVANKVSNDSGDHHRTSTGIISPLPPPPKVGLPPPLPTSNSTYKLDAIGAAKLEMARRQLYSGFLRGAAMGGSLAEEIELQRKRDAGILIEGEVILAKVQVTNSKRPREEVVEEVKVKLSKEERKIAKLQKKERKLDLVNSPRTNLNSNSALTPPTISEVSTPLQKKAKKSKLSVPELTEEEKEYQTALVFAKASLKEERRNIRKAKEKKI